MPHQPCEHCPVAGGRPVAHGGRQLDRLRGEGLLRIDEDNEITKQMRQIERRLKEERGGAVSVVEDVVIEPFAYAAVWLRMMNNHLAAVGGPITRGGKVRGIMKLYYVSFNSL